MVRTERSATLLNAVNTVTAFNANIENNTTTCTLRVRCDAAIEGTLTTEDVHVNGDLTFTYPDSCIVFGDGTQQCTAQAVGPQGPPGPNVFVSYTITLLTSVDSPFTVPALTTSGNYYNVYQLNTTGGPIVINLPQISTLDHSKQRLHYFVDVGGALTVHPVTFNTAGGDTIANETSMTLEVDYSAVQLMSNTSTKWLVV